MAAVFFLRRKNRRQRTVIWNILSFICSATDVIRIETRPGPGVLVMKYLLILIFVALLISPARMHAQSAPPLSDRELAAELYEYIRAVMVAIPELPSVAMVVVKDDKPIFMQAYGFANKEAGIRADANTHYYIASSTKSYMGLAAAMLDREGKIKLGDPMTKYAPGVKFKTPIPEKVTVRDLLTHTSALRNSPLVWRTAFSGEIDDDELLRVLAEATSYNDENYGKYGYTNLGYNIYGMLLKMSLRKKWQDVLHERVLRPLGLKNTSAYLSKLRRARSPIAQPYMFSPATETVIRAPIEKHDNNMQAAGGMFTNLVDLGKWLSVNINSGRLSGKQVIPTDVMRMVHTGYTATTRDEGPFTGGGKYGLGWQIGKYRSEEVVYHHGGYPGWSSHISYMPERKIGVAVMINESTAGGRIGHLLATYAYDRYLRKQSAEGYAKELAAAKEQYARMKQGQISSFRSRAARKSQLSRPLSDYVGRYANPLFGNFDVTIENDALAIRNGNVRVVSTPFTDKDSIRVEMTPGQGEVIKFEVAGSGVDALNYANIRFLRTVR